MNKNIYSKKTKRFVQSTKIGQTFFITGFALIIAFQSALAQRIEYDEFPLEAQLYQRDDLNTALVDIKGRFFAQEYTDVSVIVTKDNNSIYRQKQKLNFQTGGTAYADFSFQPTITAGLVVYEFYFYAHKGAGDSTLIREAKQVVCGDNIIIYGQSNAEANSSPEIEKFNDEFKFGRVVLADFNTDQYSWAATAKWNHYYAGLLGLEVQRQLIDKYKVPIGIANGSAGNTSIDELMIRNENNHEDLQYHYGKLLRKANKTGFGKKARILIWRQGESEAFEAYRAGLYAGKFEKLRNQLHEDFQSIEKIYVYQNNIYWADNDKAGDLRDFHRRVSEIYPDCETIATIGTPGFDALHYSYEGYVQNGKDVARLIARDFMNSTDVAEINSPNIQKAYFSRNHDTLILEFEADQKMQFPDYSVPKNDGTMAYFKDYIYLDGQQGKIISGRSEGNKIILKLSESSNAKKVTYCPDNFIIGYEWIQGIPYLKNSRGLHALTFKNFDITEALEVETDLTAQWDDNAGRTTIEWPNSKNQNFTLEKSVNTPLNFGRIATVSNGLYNGQDWYYDYKVKKGVKYYYRLKFDNDSYGDTIEVAVPMSPVAEQDELMRIYPNPVSLGAEIKIELQVPVQEVVLTNSVGSIVQRISTKTDIISVSTMNLKPGIYLLEAVDKDQRKVTKRIVVD